MGVLSVEGADRGREWEASRREFLADDRDSVADDREDLADARDARADAREAEQDQQDERERALNARAAGMGMTATADSGAAAAARSRAAADRVRSKLARAQANVGRDEQTRQRVAQGRPTVLALTFASIAERLYDAESYDEVLGRIAEAALTTVAGGQAASVMLLDEGTYRTVGATDQVAVAVDQAQYDVDEGPCLDAVAQAMVNAPSFPDERWPLLGAAPSKHGVESSVCYQLAGPGADGAKTGVGSLNIYAFTPDEFDDAAVEIGSILAAHASLAARAVGERASLERLDRHLQRALLSRDVIGQAKGILMERLKVSPENAFEILKRTSQQLNVKLRDVAWTLTETGEIDPHRL